MEYENIQREDLGGCAEVFVEVFSSPPWNEDWAVPAALTRLAEIGDAPGFIGVKVVLDERMIGFAVGNTVSSRDRRDFRLREMCVLPERQRQGVGTALLQALKVRLLDMNVRRLFLQTTRDGMAAAFYEKNGFSASDSVIAMGCWLQPRE